MSEKSKSIKEGRIVHNPIRENKYTEVRCLDEPGAGGACHEYVVCRRPSDAEIYDEYSTAAGENPYEADRTVLSEINFQSRFDIRPQNIPVRSLSSKQLAQLLASLERKQNITQEKSVGSR